MAESVVIIVKFIEANFMLLYLTVNFWFIMTWLAVAMIVGGYTRAHQGSNNVN